MYFISPPNIFLMNGIYDHHLLGYGEKDGKLCIYKKAVFDSGRWKEFFLTDINVLKCDSCDTGIHAAATFLKNTTIWIAAREKEYTRIFSINLGTKKFIRYKMVHEARPEFTLLNLNLCSKCLSPILRCIDFDKDLISFDITPQKYQNEIGIFRIFISINLFEQSCHLWSKNVSSFTLDELPLSSNIFINEEGEVLSLIKRYKEDGRIQTFSITTKDVQCNHNIPDVDDKDYIWHEIVCSTLNDLCIARRNEGGKSFLRLFYVEFSLDKINFNRLDDITVDEKFPSLETLHFYVKWRQIDKNYISKRALVLVTSSFTVIPSYIFFQTPNGSIITIPLEVLSLSELSYIALSRIPQPSQQQCSQLPIAEPSIYYYFFQHLRKFCGKKDDVWMSQEFIKKTTGWPKILPLIKAPNLPTKSE